MTGVKAPRHFGPRRFLSVQNPFKVASGDGILHSGITFKRPARPVRSPGLNDYGILAWPRIPRLHMEKIRI